MEKKMETTIIGYIRVILGLYWDNGKENGNYYSIYWDNGKENGNYNSILGLYWDNGKENGNYYSIILGLSCLSNTSNVTTANIDGPPPPLFLYFFFSSPPSAPPLGAPALETSLPPYWVMLGLYHIGSCWVMLGSYWSYIGLYWGLRSIYFLGY